MQAQAKNTVVSSPPMMMSDLTESDQSLEEKREVLAAEPLTVPLHQLVPFDPRARDQPEQAAPKLEGMTKSPLAKARQLLIAVNHSLNKLCGVKLADTVPFVPLRPQALEEKRIFHDSKFPYLFDGDRKTAVWQIAGGKHLRLANVADEGSSGYAVFTALASTCAIMPMRDSSHKMHRHSEAAMSGSQATKQLRKEIALCLKFDKAPWSSGRFGRRIREGVKAYVSSMGPNDELLAPLKGNLCSELQVDECDFQGLVNKMLKWAEKLGTGKSISNEYSMGRWDSFQDGLHLLFRQGFSNNSRMTELMTRFDNEVGLALYS